jgi:predicted dehydrogenase
MRALFVGLGGIGQRHLRNLRALRGAEVEVVAWRSRGLARTISAKLEVEPGEEVEKKYGVRSFATLEHALATRPDVAFICNPSSLHVGPAIAAAKAGCHLFLEKPLSNSLAGLDDLRRAATEKRIKVLIGYQLRFHPLLRRIRALLDARAVGNVVSVRAEVGEYLPGFHPYEDYRQMYAATRALGGGVALSQIHELDYLYWLFGLPRRIFALGGHLSNLEIDVEDVASALLECVGPKGAFPVHLQQDYIQRPPSRTCIVVGDSGKIVLDLREPSLRVFNEQGALSEETILTKFDRNQLFMDELRHFLDCAEGRAAPVVNLEDGIASLRMALGVLQSMESGQVVELDSLGGAT